MKTPPFFPKFQHSLRAPFEICIDWAMPFVPTHIEAELDIPVPRIPVPGNLSLILMVSKPVSKKFGTEKILEPVSKRIGTEKVSEPVSKNFGTGKSLRTGLEKSWY